MHKPLTLFLLLCSGTVPAHAEQQAFKPYPSVYRDECASCHVAYPPELMAKDGWQRFMDGLARHFGVDASLDARPQAAITAFLLGRAGQGRALSPQQAAPRLSTTSWFRHEHGSKPPAGTSFSDCAACHTRAGQSDYRESSLKLPRAYHHREED